MAKYSKEDIVRLVKEQDIEYIWATQKCGDYQIAD